MSRIFAVVVAPVVLLLSGCGDNQQPAEADALWTKIHDEGYRSFARAPGYATRTASTSAHGNMVDIYVNDVIEQALMAKKPLTAWPDGSLIVKDGFADGSPKLVAVMEKRGADWFYAEYSAEGSASYSGKPDVCTSCHSSGSDFVRAFSLPK
jgi:hypothetical protein